MSDMYDVVIAGGAMAGTTLAMALKYRCEHPLHSLNSHHTFKIAVIEAFPHDHQAHPGFDARSIALSHGTVELLKQYDLWSVICDHATPITHIHVSDKNHAGMTDFHAQKEGLDALGYVVELAEVGRLFHHKLTQQSLDQEASAQAVTIDYLCPFSVSGVEQKHDEVAISLTSNDDKQALNTREIHAKLLVAADGANSITSQALGLTQSNHDFEQVAVIANVVTSEAPQGRAFERFTAHGPLALLPMSEERSSLVWCLPPSEAQRVTSLPKAEFLHQLQQAFGWRLGRFEKVGEVSSYPLILRHRAQVVKHRFVAIGNAAQTLHPIAGQGFNLGIRDIATLVECLFASSAPMSHQCETDDFDIGIYAKLSQFQQLRQDDRQKTIAMTAGLVQIFSNDHFALQLGRNIGLAIMDNVPQVKAPIFNRALGLVNCV